MVDGAEHQAGCCQVSVDCCSPVGVLNRVEASYLQGAEFVDRLDLAVGQGLMEMTVRGMSRAERNALRTVQGDFAAVDRDAMQRLTAVLAA